MPTFTDDDREMLRSAARAVNDLQSAGTAVARSYRNVLAVATVLLAVVAVLFPLLVARGDGRLMDLNLAAPGQGRPAVPWGYPQIASIELWGVLGALVGAVAGLRNVRGAFQPIGLQLAQIALKLPAGALTALAGVVLLQAALTPTTQAVSAGKIAALAVIFGVAQEALTAFVDRTAARILDKTRTPSDRTVSA
jgi:hypothetical protein